MTRPLPKSITALDDDALAMQLMDRRLQIEATPFRAAILERIRLERWWCQRCPSCMADEGVRCDYEIPDGLKCRACNEVDQWPECNDLADALHLLDRGDDLDERHSMALLEAWWEAEEEKSALREELARVRNGDETPVAYRVFTRTYQKEDIYVIETYQWDGFWTLFINGQQLAIPFRDQFRAEQFALDITRPALQPSACKCEACVGRKVA